MWFSAYVEYTKLKLVFVGIRCVNIKLISSKSYFKYT